ncbi:hypothetical protein EOW77_0006030 [Bradyrhizobium yuanmingense]|uniref:hypothetical protein n=1 Tax=Bradyrhizobium yuanmingense TaxID=108015 RepID=UPI000FE2DDDA|nr:hypothetical protein [Bradyrhizobium yuanmingense]TGN89858.1 hypothetical protein EOW77_0006030 [Bradyrhizobium yuanmingense]
MSALIAGGSSIVVSFIAFWVQRAKLRHEFEIDVAQAKTGFMAETLVRELLTQYDAPFRTFVMIRHHIGGFTDDELRRILVRAGALRFMSKTGIELWALHDRVRNYKASWDTKAEGYLSVWRLPVDPTTPDEAELFPARLERPTKSMVAGGQS